MSIAITLLSAFHPGRVLVGSDSEFPSLSCAQKREKRKAKKETKKLAKLARKMAKSTDQRLPSGFNGKHGFVELASESPDLEENRMRLNDYELRPNVFEARRG